MSGLFNLVLICRLIYQTIKTEGEKKMPKIKTHRGAAKRFGVTKHGKLKRGKAYRSHILNKKTTKRKRKLRKMGYLAKANAATIKGMIPYK